MSWKKWGFHVGGSYFLPPPPNKINETNNTVPHSHFSKWHTFSLKVILTWWRQGTIAWHWGSSAADSTPTATFASLGASRSANKHQLKIKKNADAEVSFKLCSPDNSWANYQATTFPSCRENASEMNGRRLSPEIHKVTYEHVFEGMFRQPAVEEYGYEEVSRRRVQELEAKI